MNNLYPEQGAETRLVMETAYGSLPSSPTWKRINGLSFMLKPSATVNFFTPKGAYVPTVPMVDDKMGEVSYNGVIDFNGLTYVLYGVLGLTPTYSSLGGSPAAYSRIWTWNGRRRNKAASFSVHKGYPDSAMQMLGVILNSLGISGARPDGFSVSGKGFGKFPTDGNTLGGVTNEVQTLARTGTVSGGTFTITLDSYTTATIAYNATASAIQTALEALPNVEPGDIVATGGPAGTSDVIFTFGGTYGGQDVSLMTVASGSLVGGGSYGITQTTAGADAVSDVVAEVAGAILGNAYLDSSWANIGTTQLGYCLGMSVDIAERLGRVTPNNKSQTTDGVMDNTDQDHNFNLVLAKNAIADAELTKLSNGTLVFPRVEWEGDTISGGNKYLLQIDAATVYTDIGEESATQNALTRDYASRVVIDDTSGNALRVKLVNTVANPI